MKPPSASLSAARRPQSAFTMVEIAFSLAVIGIALVSIIGVLPQGVNVQRDNRRETIVNQDANYFVEAIRGGGRGLDDLTNYVTTITNFWTKYSPNNVLISAGVDSYTNAPLAVLSYPDNRFKVTSVNVSPAPVDIRLTNGLTIIGVLSTPKYLPSPFGDPPGTFISNYVVAYVQAISGAAMEKYPQTNAIIRDSAFSYRMVVDLTPFRSGLGAVGAPSGEGFFYPDWTNYLAAAGGNLAVNNAIANWTLAIAQKTNANADPAYYLTNFGVNVNLPAANVADFQARANYWLLSRQVTPNLNDLRLLFRWPLLPGGRIGNGRQTYRAMIGGQVLTGTNAADTASPLHFVSSQNYTNIDSLP